MFTHAETPRSAKTPWAVSGAVTPFSSAANALHIAADGVESTLKKSKSISSFAECVPESLRGIGENLRRRVRAALAPHMIYAPQVQAFEVDPQGSGVMWAVCDTHVYCWDALGRESRALQLPDTNFEVTNALVAPSGQQALGVIARRWLLVTVEGQVALYGPGSDEQPAAVARVALAQLDSPWRLHSGHAGLVSDGRDNRLHHCWALCTRDGRVFEICADVDADRLRCRLLCAPRRQPRSLWGSLVSALWSGGSGDEEGALLLASPLLLCCCVAGGTWLVLDEANVVTALVMHTDTTQLRWQSLALQQDDAPLVVDMVFDFRCNHLFVLRLGETHVLAFVLTSDGLAPLQRHQLGGRPATASSRLLLSPGNAGVVTMIHTDSSGAGDVSGAALNASDASFNAGNVSMSAAAAAAALPVSVEKVEEMSNELCGSLVNDYWLEWAEKVNDAPLDIVGKTLRSRVVKHKALYASNALNKLVRENNDALLAVYGFFGSWSELSASGDAECVAALRADIIATLGATIGSNSTRRLSARSIHVFNMLWSCCPLIDHILSKVLRRYATGQQPHSLQNWALRLLIGATLPLAAGLDGVGAAGSEARRAAIPASPLIKADVILAFVSSDNFANHRVDARVVTQLALAAALASRDPDEKVVALGVLGRYGPPALHRSACEELALPLPLVLLAVHDFLRQPPAQTATLSSSSPRDTLHRYLQQYGRAFEVCLWQSLIAQRKLAIALDIANDGAQLSASLFAYLAQFPNPALFGLHALQCRRYAECAGSLVSQARSETAVLPRKRTLASLALLAALCQPVGAVPDAVRQELRLCKVAAAVQMSGPVTSETTLAHIMRSLAAPQPRAVPWHVLCAAGLELCAATGGGGDAASEAKLWQAAYGKDDWAGRIGAQLDRSISGFEDHTVWMAQSTLAQLFHSIPAERRPSLEQFLALMTPVVPDARLLTSVFYAIQQQQQQPQQQPK